MAAARTAPTAHSAPTGPVRYERRRPVAVVTMDRPDHRNARSSAMTYALDRAFHRAADDDGVKVAALAGARKHFSAGHDIDAPERDTHRRFNRKAGLWWDHSDKQGTERRFARESEVCPGMCRRRRELPRPVIASVQGACVAGGLMLAWICDLIIASDDVFFADPVVRMGMPGVEYFAHPWVMPPRIAKEFLFTGGRMPAQRAYEVGMVNQVVPRADLPERTLELAGRIDDMPRLGLALTKRDVNQAENLQGLHTGIDPAFGLHHMTHAHNAETAKAPLGGMDIRAMQKASG
ncbi:enoyl-CoA hydratase [Streptomyces sp. KLOTTS4A1]|uniref:enoyl-CoA hydratase n=1 Tax=Streptomyces sp. KLOTTS4A1 TaxID=3390996 RepID=UPI0039F5EB7B